ncbi:MAG: tyrosine-type recombinase/integrase [Psychrosphaera sp.]|nr:tyrosine-type recombinase/integrase [Psychrosphaera sp.]
MTLSNQHSAWNKGKLVGQKQALKLEEIWRIRIHLELNNQLMELALFNLALDSKLRSCDLLALKVRDIMLGGHVQSRVTIRQQKTQTPVQFELTYKTRDSINCWTESAHLNLYDFLFPSKRTKNKSISYHSYSRLVKSWVTMIGLDASRYGTHSMRRTKASLIYSRTKNLRAIQLLLGHSKLESTVRYLGVEIEDALAISENTDI